MLPRSVATPGAAARDNDAAGWKEKLVRATIHRLSFVFTLLAASALARAQPVVLGTFSDGNLAVVLPTPAVALPAPAQVVAAGLPADARPHGVAHRFADEALFADFFLPRVFRVRVSTGQLIGTVALPGRTSGNGSIAISPDGDTALAIGERNESGQPLTAESVVIRGLASGNLVVAPLQPALRVRRFASAAIAFAPNGRAFVCHVDGIAVVDPPYSTVAFNVALPASTATSACRLSPDGQRLFVARSGSGIGVVEAPFSSASVPVTILAPAGAGALGPMAVSPDGNAVLVGQVNRTSAGNNARLFIARAPFTAATTMQEIALPAALAGPNCGTGAQECPGFEDMDTNTDGSLAILTGNSSVLDAGFTGRAPLAVIRNPFVDATREVLAVAIGSVAQSTHGRGTGGVRFQPPALPLFGDSFE
jgi:hypothetical protein